MMIGLIDITPSFGRWNTLKTNEDRLISRYLGARVTQVATWYNYQQLTNGVYLEDHPRTCKWLTNMVSKSARPGVVGLLPNGLFMANKWGGDPNYLLTERPILQVLPTRTSMCLFDNLKAHIPSSPVCFWLGCWYIPMGFPSATTNHLF